MSRNTDVSGAIAGYHKQIYMACLELAKLTNDDDSIGVECGADVRTFYTDGSKKSCEVKFYKENFHKYSEEIIKTIYNFYINSHSDKELVFTTNVGNNDKEFFDLWKEGNLSDFEKQRYILHALIKFESTKDKKLKEKIDNYNTENIQNINKAIEKLTINILRKNIEFSSYIQNPNIKFEFLKDFSDKMKFNFEDKDKKSSAKDIQEKITEILESNFKDLTPNIDTNMYTVIIHKTAMLFFDSTIANSLQIYNGQYEKYKKISLKQFKEIIINYEKYIDKYSEDVLLTRLIEVFDEKEVMNVNSIVTNFEEDYSNYKEIIKGSKEKISSTQIKYLFHQAKVKFSSTTERDLIVERYTRYQEGFGLIAFLMDLDISSLTIYKDKVEITTFYNKHLQIINKDHYELENISNYIEDKCVDKNFMYRYMLMGSYSFQELIYPNPVPVIDVYKQERALSLSDYVEFNGINEKTYYKLEEICENKNHNALILYPSTTRAIKLVNALVSQIPKQQSVIIIAEDVQSKLSSQFGHSLLEINSLSGNFNEKLKKISYMPGLFDRKIYLIHNYETDLSKKIETILGDLGNKDKGIITALEYSFGTHMANLSYDEILEKLTFITSEIAREIDYIIFLWDSKKKNEDCSSRNINNVEVIAKHKTN